MGAVDHSLAVLNLTGDDLVPDEVSALLGAAPTEAFAKGDRITSSSTGNMRISRSGKWSLEASRREPEDLEAQVFEVLIKLSGDLGVWSSLARFHPHFFCGIFMGSGNDGLDLPANVLLALGQRGIELCLDIYDAHD